MTLTHTVVSGDTLGKIAARYGTTVGVLAELNGIADVNLVRVGQLLDLPGAQDPGGVDADELAEIKTAFQAFQVRLDELADRPYTVAAEPGADLDSFDGASDDDKLTAAISHVGAQTFPPPIELRANRAFGPFEIRRELPQGFSLLGGPGFSNQQRSARSVPQRVDVATAGSWLNVSNGPIFDVEIGRLSFQARRADTVFLTTPNRGHLWTSKIHDVGFTEFKHVFGDKARQLIMTACVMDGWFNINNGRDVAMRFAGSDNTLFTDGCLLDSPTARTSGGDVAYHLHCDWLEKSNIGPMFITAEGQPAAIRIDGSRTQGALVFRGGIRAEGRNRNQPALGAVVHMTGGVATFRDAWLSYGMRNPAALSSKVGSSRRAEKGVVHVSGGELYVDGGFYARAVDESVPWIYATGANTKVRVFNTRTLDDGGTFTGVPVVTAANGASIVHDDTVRQIPA